MTYLVIPTRIEIIDNTDILSAVVEANDDVSAIISINSAVGFDEWLNLSDAIRKSLHMLQLDVAKPQTSSTPHGY